MEPKPDKPEPGPPLPEASAAADWIALGALAVAAAALFVWRRVRAARGRGA